MRRNRSKSLTGSIKTSNLQRLLNCGRKNGKLTYSDINRALSRGVSPEKLDRLVGKTREEGIQIVEHTNDSPTCIENNALNLFKTKVASREIKNNDQIDNAYFFALGRLPLLTREGEVEVALRIEKEQNRLRDIILSSELHLPEITEVSTHDRSGLIRFVSLPFTNFLGAKKEKEQKQVLEGILEQASAREAKRQRLTEGIPINGTLSATRKRQHAQRMKRIRASQYEIFQQLRVNSRFWYNLILRLKGTLEDYDAVKESEREKKRLPRKRAGVRTASKAQPAGVYRYRSVTKPQMTGSQVERITGLRPSELRPLLKQLQDAYDRVEKAISEMVEANLKIVVTFAMKQTDRTVPISDLIQEGNLGLIRAVEKYDYRRGHRFSTYAVWWIRQAIKRSIIDHSQMIHLPVHTNEHIWKMARISDEFINTKNREPTSAELSKKMGLSLRKVKNIQEAPSYVMSLDSPLKDDQDRPLIEFVQDDDIESADDKMIRSERADYVNRILELLSKRERYVLKKRFGFGRGGDHTLREIGEDLGVSRERIRQIEAEALDKLRNSREEVLKRQEDQEQHQCAAG